MTDADDYTAFLVAEERARNERLRAPAHDPLCHAYALTVNGGYHDPECCDCELIARVRGDERTAVVRRLRDNYGDDYDGPVNLAAVFRIIGGAE